jgi:hypothetical protein
MTDYTKIQVQTRPRSYGGAPFVLAQWELLKPTWKRCSKKERHTGGPPEKRTKMKLTSLHNLGNSVPIPASVKRPVLFFEQRARPPKVACPCSKNKGHTRIR